MTLVVVVVVFVSVRDVGGGVGCWVDVGGGVGIVKCDRIIVGVTLVVVGVSIIVDVGVVSGVIFVTAVVSGLGGEFYFYFFGITPFEYFCW